MIGTSLASPINNPAPIATRALSPAEMRPIPTTPRTGASPAIPADCTIRRLWMSREGRQILAAIFESELLDSQSVHAVPVEKDWMVAGKMVDLLWAPGAASRRSGWPS